MPDNITVLETVGSKLLVKTWLADGQLKPYDGGKNFFVTESPVDGIRGLHIVLRKLQQKPNRCIIRGRQRSREEAHRLWSAKPHFNDDGTPETFPERKLVYRRNHFFAEQPLHSFLIDIDDANSDIDPLVDGAAAVHQLVLGRLPPEFHQSTYSWQLSNSVGHPSKEGKISAHLWFWSTEAVKSSELAARLSWCAAIDSSLFRTVQPHFTGAPVFEGVADPVKLRSGLFIGTREDVTLPSPMVSVPVPAIEVTDLVDPEPDVDESNQWRRLNNEAMRRLAEWVPALYPHAEPYRDGYRITSESLGRDLEEAISIVPQGIVDFGTHDIGDPRQGKRSPIDLCMQLSPDRCPTKEKAAVWLCSRLGIDPAVSGFSKANTPAKFVDFTTLASRPAPRRRWVRDEWLIRGKMTLVAGGAGFGKTKLAEQLQTCISNDLPWLGIPGAVGPTLGLYCEDDEDELLYRQQEIFRGYGLDPAKHSGGNYQQSRVGLNNILVSFGAERLPKRTAAFDELWAMCEQIRPIAVILDNAAQMYGGLENDRPLVTAFCNELSGLALHFDSAVMLLAHPAKAEGSEYSGSTAWEAAVRARLFLERQKDGSLKLKKAKANYSRLEEIELEYHDGIFQRRKTVDTAQAAAFAMPLLHNALAVFTRRQIATSHEDRAKNNLVKLAEQDHLLQNIPAAAAKAALSQMLDTGAIFPNELLPWKDKSRHKVYGLSAALGGTEGNQTDART